MRTAVQAWRTVRVYISSTFRDMHAERDHLVKAVFPALRERLQPHRIHLVDVDLRWGVTQQQAEDDRATELCLQQVDACKPFFICVLGARYGHVPNRLPASTTLTYPWLREATGRSITELEVLAGLGGERWTNRRALFFFRGPGFIADVPAARRADVCEEDAQAQQKLSALKQAVRRAELAAEPQEFACTYRGLRMSARLSTLNLTPEERGALEAVTRDGVVEPAEYDGLGMALRELVDREAVVYTGGLDSFGRQVHERLWDAIRVELALPDAPSREPAEDSVDAEEESQERFRESRIRLHIERPAVLGPLLQHAQGEQAVPLLLAGPPGSGKSALMARLVQALEALAELPASPGHLIVVSHFVGASQGSASLRRMLRRLCLSLRPRTGTSADIPDDTDGLIGELQRTLEGVAPTDRVVVVVDALDQLDAADNAHALHWLPRDLPAQVRVIVSCVNDAVDPAFSAAKGAASAAQGHRIQAVLGNRPHRRVNVPPLSDEERRAIVSQVPSLAGKTLDQEQVGLLLGNAATRNPLFLLVALEELRGFGSYEQLERRIRAFPAEGDTLTGLFVQVLESLEEEFGPELVRRALSYVGCSRDGLSEQELVELVAGASPALYLVLRQVRPYMQERGALLDFFHQNLRQAVRQRYLQSPAEWRHVHAELAAFFHRKADPGGLGEWSGTPRALDQLPHHLAEAGDASRLREVTLDLRFLQAKLFAFDVRSLIDDLRRAERLTPADSAEATTIGLLRDALRLSTRQLAGDPTQLLTQIWGRLVYQRAPGVRATLESFVGRATAPWLRLWTPSLTGPGPLLWEARLARDELNSGARACVVPDASAVMVAGADGKLSIFSPDSAVPIAVLEGRAQAGPVLDLVATSDGQRVLGLRADGSVDVWNVGDQVLEDVQQYPDRAAPATPAAITRDGAWMVTGTAEGVIELHRLDGTIPPRSFQGPPSRALATAVNQATTRVASVHADGSVLVWDVQSGQLVELGPDAAARPRVGMDSSLQRDFPPTLALSDDGERVFVGSSDMLPTNIHFSAFSSRSIEGQLSCRGTTTAGSAWTITVDEESPVRDLDVTSEGDHAVTQSGRGLVRLWDLRRTGEQARLDQHAESPPIVAVTPDGRRVLSTSDDGMLLIWDLTTGKVDRCRGYRDPAFALRVSPDGRFAVVVSAGHCQAWTLDPPGMGPVIGTIASSSNYGMPDVWMRAVGFPPTAGRLLTVGSDGAVVTWDVTTGKQVRDPIRLPHEVTDATFSASGRWLLYRPHDQGLNRAGSASTLVLYDLDGNVPARVHRLDGADVTDLFAAPVGGSFRVEQGDGAAWTWDPERQAPTPAPPGDLRLSTRTVSADGRFALGYGNDLRMTLYDLRSNLPIASYTGDTKFSSVALSANGDLIALGDAAKRVHVLWPVFPVI